MDVIERMSVVIGSNVSKRGANGVSERHQRGKVSSVRVFQLSLCSNAAGSSDEGRRGGGDPSEVLYAELRR